MYNGDILVNNMDILSISRNWDVFVDFKIQRISHGAMASSWREVRTNSGGVAHLLDASVGRHLKNILRLM